MHNQPMRPLRIAHCTNLALLVASGLSIMYWR